MIKYWGKLPLKPHIYIKVVDLVVILNKGREEQFFGKCQVKPGSYQHEISIVIWFGEHYPFVGSFDGQVTVGLHPVNDFTVQAEPCSIEKPSNFLLLKCRGG
ncbi:hypothetical protein ES705_50202 [subsurface metagenome]